MLPPTSYYFKCIGQNCRHIITARLVGTATTACCCHYPAKNFHLTNTLACLATATTHHHELLLVLLVVVREVVVLCFADTPTNLLLFQILWAKLQTYYYSKIGRYCYHHLLLTKKHAFNKYLGLLGYCNHLLQ